eukprot:scaffold118491_cov86-Attheya_sp.AAC.1
MIRPNRWDQNHAAAAGTWRKVDRIGGKTIYYDWGFSSRRALFCVPGGSGILYGMISVLGRRVAQLWTIIGKSWHGSESLNLPFCL